MQLIFLSASDKVFIFIGFVFIGLALLLGLFISYFFPKKRIWPPPKKNSWQFWYTWILATLGYFGILVMGIIDYGSLGLNNTISFIVGLPLFIGGLLFAYWGVRTLSTHQSLGLHEKLVTNGPYRYTRNPQYVGDIIAIIGFILMSNSSLTAIIGFIGILWFLFAPFTEEPLLTELYGEDYVKFCKKVPRFLSLKSFQKK